MKRLLGTVGLATAIAVLAVGRPLGAQNAPKRPLAIDDVVAFKSIGATVLSPDGQWLAYRMGPQEGDAEVIVRGTSGSKEMRFPVGQGNGPFAFSDDSAWIGITTSATKREADAARRANRTLQTGVTLVNLATEKEAVIHLRYRPGHFLVQGHPYATVWPASVADQVARELARAHVTGPYRTLAQDVSFGIDQLVEICIRALSSAVNDTFTALTCIDWIGDSLCKVTGRWQPTRVYRDPAGTVRLIATQVTYQRLVQRAFEKVRQSGRGMPAVMIRQLDALAKIMERATAADDCAVLLDQAAMIQRLSEATVDEESDRNDVRRAYRRVLDVHAGVTATAVAPAT